MNLRGGPLKNNTLNIAFALACVWVAFVAQRSLSSELGLTFLLFYPAVFFSSALAGWVGGLVATLFAATLAGYFFIPPFESFRLLTFGAAFQLGVFAVMGLLITFFTWRFKRSNEALRETARREDLFARELQLKSDALENSLNGFDIVNEHGEFVYVNRAYLKMWGYSSMDEVLASSPADHCADKEVPGQIISRLKATGECDIEFVAQRKDGSTFDVHMLARRAYDAQGREIYPTTSVDITERKSMEDTLRSSEAQFHMLAESIPQLSWMARADGYIFWYNRRWYEYTGTTPEEMEGWGWQKVHEPSALPSVLERWRWSIESGVHFEMEFPLRAKDGSYRWFLTRGAPVRDSRGRIIRWIGTNTDIEEQKRTRADLESTVRSRDEFLSIASHELKTPITSLKLQLQMTQRGLKPSEGIGPSPEQLAKVLEVTNRQVNRLTNLVEDLLDVSRIQAGRLKFKFEDTDLSSIVREVAERFAEASAIGVPLRFDLEKGVMVNCDRFRIEQVIVNLISNAEKYGSGTPITLEMRKAANSAVLVVRDEGIGIERDQHERIFERFERAVSSSRISGLGLGLFIVREIVEAHHGSIRVESEPGKGSAFIIEIPFHQPQKKLISGRGVRVGRGDTEGEGLDEGEGLGPGDESSVS